MLSFEDKLAILDSFPQLQRKAVSLGRMNYHYEDSAYDKKIVAYHIHPNGNGFVYAGQLQGYQLDDKGFVNIREFTEEELRNIIQASIQSLTGESVEKKTLSKATEERWIDQIDQILILTYQDDMWYVYDGSNIESVFETYSEAQQYLKEEGFLPYN